MKYLNSKRELIMKSILTIIVAIGTIIYPEVTNRLGIILVAIIWVSGGINIKINIGSTNKKDA